MFKAHLAIKRFLLLFWQPVFTLLVQLNGHHTELYSKYKENNINISNYIVELVIEIYYRRIKIIFPKLVDLEIENMLDLSHFGPSEILEKYCPG